MPAKPYNIATLIFIQNIEGKFLLLQRRKPPNKGLWSPVGGKLDMDQGESPFECAIRETFEETKHSIESRDLHLFSIVTEKNYEGKGHWLLFLFKCLKPLPTLPEDIDEGSFQFFNREAINELAIPKTDKNGLWALYDEFGDSFCVTSVDGTPENKMEIIVEQVTGVNALKTNF